MWNLINPLNNSTYYNTIKLLVAGRERESEWDATVWGGVSPYTKSEKCPGIPLSLISFTYGPSFGYRAPEKRRPSGSLNFSNADRPTLWLNITDTLPASTGKKKVVLRVVTVGWGLYDVKDNRGTLVFSN